MQSIENILSNELKQDILYVKQVIKLLDEGNTVPFIARYRKEMHGSMDDQIIRQLADRLIYLRNLEERRKEIFKAISEQEKMTDELQKALENAQTLAEINDIYAPYRPKRRTKAMIAKERGLEPLAKILKDTIKGDEKPLEEVANSFINDEVKSIQEAIEGACCILSEILSEDANLRKNLREFIWKTGVLQTRGDENDQTYKMYCDFSQSLKKLQSHRILAINRGEKEKKIKVSLEVEKEQAQIITRRAIIHPKSAYKERLEHVCVESYDKYIFPSLEREIRSDLTSMANEQAIKTFGTNLRQLLMQPPVRGKVILGFDPAYRTGCKLAVVDETGFVKETSVIYPTPPHNKTDDAKKILQKLCEKNNVECIAIGNGTASKESEIFIAEFIKEYNKKYLKDIQYMVVSEAGASVYSASKLGAEEFPDYDVSLRSAVSIARRLQDPLAELVKIDPKAIGVGQYQHDMPKARLGEALDGVVEDCVSSVGVDVNTASSALLERVAGVSSSVSKNITLFREQNGRFESRKQLLKVKGLGAKAYEQCAGFLRVLSSDEVLDRTAVHPESYDAARNLLKVCLYTQSDINNGNFEDIINRIDNIGKEEVAKQCKVGVPTLIDIVKELQKPGLDPRDSLPKPILRSDVVHIEDLKSGMNMSGTVRNVTDFGAFIDIGVHQDGLVHISEISQKYIKHPMEVLRVGDIVNVKIISVDVNEKKISLSIKQAN